MSRRPTKRQSCSRKKVHYNFWTVIQHCVSLQKMVPADTIVVYKCKFCEGMHIARGNSAKSMAKVRRSLAGNLKIMGHPHFWIYAPKEVIEHHIMVEIELLKLVLGLKPLTYQR